MSAPKAIKASVRVGSHSWAFQRSPDSEIVTQFLMAFLFAVFAVALLIAGIVSVLLLPVHLALKACGRPGILGWDLEVRP